MKLPMRRSLLGDLETVTLKVSTAQNRLTVGHTRWGRGEGGFHHTSGFSAPALFSTFSSIPYTFVVTFAGVILHVDMTS